MNTYNSFDELVAGQTAMDNLVGCNAHFTDVQTENIPHLSFGELGVDYRIEHYAEEGVVADMAAQAVYETHCLQERKPVYGIIPDGHPLLEILKSHGIEGHVVSGQMGGKLTIGTSVPANAKPLPQRWLKSAEVTWGNDTLKKGGSDV